MSSKRSHAHVSERTGQSTERSTAKRPSSRGNILVSEDHDVHMTDEPTRPHPRRISKSPEGTASDVGSDHATPTARKKAEPVKSACVQCQKRKTKCSGQRPVCRFCSERGLECSWDIGDGMTRTADLKKKLQEATGRSVDLDTLVDAMRHSTDDVSTMLLAKLRLGAAVEDLAYEIRGESSPTESGGYQSESTLSQASERPANRGIYDDYSSYSPTSPTHLSNWRDPNIPLQPPQPYENLTMDNNAIREQRMSQQSSLAYDFDQSRMVWGRNNSLQRGSLPQSFATTSYDPQIVDQFQRKGSAATSISSRSSKTSARSFDSADPRGPTKDAVAVGKT